MATVTWSELMAATSLAADSGMGLPLETGLATCLVAGRLGERLGLGVDELRRVHQLALLQHIGCTTASETVAAVVGNELLMREHAATLDFGDQRAMFRFMLGHVGRANPVTARPVALFKAIAGGPRIMATAGEICEAGRLLGTRCGYAPDSLADLDAVYESWDGTGVPGGLGGDQIPVPTRVVQVAALAVNVQRLMSQDAVATVLATRRGHALAPEVVDAMTSDVAGLLAVLDTEQSLWDAVIAASADGSPDEQDLDAALAALGDFADLKSHFHVGHSRGVAELAGRAAGEYGLPADTRTLLRHAGYVHDIGRVAVSSAIWNAPRHLRPHEREQVRLHPYHTQQVLSRTPFLRTLAEVASCHHERLDGSGYFRGATGTSLSAAARVLAAADTFRTKTEARPHRPALDPGDASSHLRAEASGGRLDPLAVDAVLAAAGAAPRFKHPRLTPREVEILREVARGGSMREIARALTISPKTVDGHLQRIYPKIGVSTRAGATLYTLEHGLLTGAAGSAEEGENSP